MVEEPDMAAGNLSMALEQGATYRQQLRWMQPPAPDAASTDPRVPYDLTGCTAHMQIRTKVNNPVLVELYDGDGITVNPDGTIDIVIASERTMVLEVKKAVYDLYVTFPNGDSMRVIQGPITVSLAVTDPVE